MFYLFFGVLTTVVNFCVYFVMTREFGVDAFASNLVAICIAILFAYVTNSNFVFVTKKHQDFWESLFQMLSFVVSRLMSLGLDVLLFYFMVTIGQINDMFAKIVIAIVVIVFNYIASKFFVFNK